MKVKKITIFTSVLAIIALAVGFVGCDRIAPMMPDDMPQMMDEDITVGVVVSLTGKDAQPYGLPMKRGFIMARDEINNAMLGGSIKFILEDDKSSEQGAIAAVQKLVDKGVSAIVGIAISDYLEDAFPIAQDAGVVAFSSVSTAAGLSSIGDFVFRTGLAVDIVNPSGVMLTHEQLGYKKVALIYDAADTYSVSSNDELKTALEGIGVEILTEETFQTGETDFSTQLTNIMNMAPDALFISALSVEMTQVVIQAGDLGIPDTVQLIVPDLTATEIQQAGAAAEGAIAFSGWTSLSNIPGNQDFIQKYRAKYGIDAEPWAAQSYATLNILAAAIAKAQSTDSAAIRDALAQTMDFPTILGNFSFDPNGEAVYDPIVLMVKDGELQLFSAPPVDEMPPMEAPEVTIGIAVAETGENAEPYGLPMKRGLELARDQLNMQGANIQFVYVDAMSTIEGGKAAVQELVNKGVPAIVGIGISTHLKQAFPIAQEAGVVAFSPISSAAGLSKEVGDYVFRAGIATNILVPGGVMKTHAALNYENVALIYDEADTYSTSLKEELEKALTAANVNILTVEKYKTGETDFNMQLTNIKSMEPDALFVASLSREMKQIITQAGTLGIPASSRLIVPDLTNSEVEAVGEAAENAVTFAGWSSLTDTPKNQAFVQSYMDKHGFTPGPWAAQAFATLNILANAIAKAGSTDSAAIRDALAKTSHFSTILGPFSFDPYGEAIYEDIETIVLTVKDGVLQNFQ